MGTEQKLEERELELRGLVLTLSALVLGDNISQEARYTIDKLKDVVLNTPKTTHNERYPTA